MDRLLQKRCGEGFVIARKGWEGRGKANLFADEELVISAVLTAIMRGTEVVILTRDNDLAFQVIELMSTIGAQYETMCAAAYFADNMEEHKHRFANPLRAPEGVNHPFAGKSGIAFTFSSDSFPPLPPFIPAVVHCLVFSGATKDQKLFSVTYCGETGMRKLLDVKKTTQGKNTDRFGDKNAYLTRDPIDPVKRQCFILCEENYVHRHGLTISTIDIIQASLVKRAKFHYLYGKEMSRTHGDAGLIFPKPMPPKPDDTWGDLIGKVY
jgi:hypothetical protein